MTSVARKQTIFQLCVQVPHKSVEAKPPDDARLCLVTDTPAVNEVGLVQRCTGALESQGVVLRKMGDGFRSDRMDIETVAARKSGRDLATRV